MNLAFESVASEQLWWRIGCALALVGMAFALWSLTRQIEPDSGRLYWEYAGRMLHEPVTNGYIEWIQHRTGVAPALNSAVPAARRLAPYTDFPCEYPPGSLLFFVVVRYFGNDIQGFSRALENFSGAMFFTVMAISLRYVRKLYLAANSGNLLLLYLALPLIAISPILIGPFAVIRFDMLPAFFAIAGLSLFLKKLPLPAAFMLGVGAATKLWPGIFIPLIAAHYWKRGTANIPPIAMIALGIVGFLIPHLVVIAMGTRPADALNYLKFLSDRPPQAESLVANIAVILSYLTGSHVTGGFDFGSQNIYSIYSNYIIKIASAINAILLVFAFFSVLKRANLGKASADADMMTIFACGFAVCITMVCARVFSGEYMMWPLPLVLFLILDSRGAIGALFFIFALIMLKATYWAYDGLIAAKLPGTLVCFGKNLLLVVVSGVFGSRMLNSGNTVAKAETRQ